MDEQTIQEIAGEIARQLKNEKALAFGGHETNGLTQRDLIIEMRLDIKDLKAQVPNFVTKGQMFTGGLGVAGIVLGVVKLFF